MHVVWCMYINVIIKSMFICESDVCPCFVNTHEIKCCIINTWTKGVSELAGPEIGEASAEGSLGPSVTLKQRDGALQATVNGGKNKKYGWSLCHRNLYNTNVKCALMKAAECLLHININLRIAIGFSLVRQRLAWMHLRWRITYIPSYRWLMTVRSHLW